MWTPATRGRMAKIEKKTKRYPSDLTDEEWARIEPLLPRASKAGRPIEVDLREVLNAIRYMARSGGGWRMLPNDFPPWQTVYWWFRRFIRRFMFQTIHDVALMLDRERVGREASPTGGVVDSQSVKAPEAKTRGLTGAIPQPTGKVYSPSPNFPNSSIQRADGSTTATTGHGRAPAKAVCANRTTPPMSRPAQNPREAFTPSES